MAISKIDPAGLDLTGDAAFDTDTLVVDSTNNRVGIGTSSPSALLNVVSNNDSVVLIESDGTDSGDDARLEIKTTNGTFTIQNDRSLGTSGVLTFAGNTSNNLAIDHNSGNVGIGTTNPATALDIERTTGTVTVQLQSRDASNCAIDFGDNDDADVGRILYAHSDNSMRFVTSTNERMRIGGGGVYFNTTATPSTTSFGFRFGGDVLYSFRNTNGGGACARIGGSLGEVQVRGDGDLYNTNGTYGQLSDARLKENIVNANSQWDDIKALQFKNYNLIDFPDQTMLGVIAQDLEESGMSGLVVDSETVYWTEEDELPEGVLSGDVKEESRKTVKYSILYMKAVKALQEAIGRIETLEAEKDAQATQIADLVTRIEALEAN